MTKTSSKLELTPSVFQASVEKLMEVQFAGVANDY